jgi:hypothetical protein
MEGDIRNTLSGWTEFERYDDAAAQSVFEQLNEQWEEQYAAVFSEEETVTGQIPRRFLDGRRAFIFHMFYRVALKHEEEVKKIEQEGRWQIV